MHHSSTLIREAAATTGSCTITLERGDTAWHPASTKKVLAGVGRVSYVVHPDGGVDASIEDEGVFQTQMAGRVGK